MKTSDELTRQHNCSNYRADIPLSNYNPIKTYQHTQEEVVMRMLQGEEIADVPAELSYQLTKNGYRFEDSIQRNNRLYYAAKDIVRYVNSCGHRDKKFVSEEDSVITFRDEHIRALPTYYYVDDYGLTVVKVKADTYQQTYTEDSGKQTSIDERENDESYALMLLARKLRDQYYPGLGCRLEYNHLKDVYTKPKRGELPSVYMEDFFEEGHTANIVVVEDGPYYDKFFEAKWAIEDRFPITCGGASCSGCGCYTACHYTEPPLVDDNSNLVKNPDDVRLSYEQRQVVTHNQGSLLVDSGAGAGKTTCITMRILELLRNGVDPRKICLLTFTNAAAKEMMDRVAMYTRAVLNDPEKAGQLPPDLDINDITGCTFNGLCQQVIEAYHEELGFERVPQVIPYEMEQQMVHDIFDLYPEKIPGWNYNMASKSIYEKTSSFTFGKSAAAEFLALAEKVKMTPSDEYRWKELEDLKQKDKSPLPHKYVVQLKMMLEDFDAAHVEKVNGLSSSGKAYITYLDQFLLVEKLFEQHPTLWDEYGFSHIIVDEVQDSNPMQLKLLERMQNNASYISLCSVGDMQQSIYGFNGAVPENMLHSNYEGFFGPTTCVSIRENFRCSRDVIGFTNTIIDSTIQDTQRLGIQVGENEYEHLIGTRDSVEPVHVFGYYSQQSQMEDIAKQIQGDLDRGIMPGDIMFITRNKSQLNMLASELTKRNIPSVLRCPVPYIENSNVGTAISFMDSYLYNYEEGYFNYCNQLKHGSLFEEPTETIREAIEAFQAEVNGKPHSMDTLQDYLKVLDVEEKDECYQSFLKSFQYVRSLPELEEKLFAFKQHGSKSTFKREATYGEVQLSTIHSAKGLESKVIYSDIGKLDEAMFHEPRLSQSVASAYKETNRLEYVAYTRAKDKLVVTAPYVVADRGGKPILNKRLIRAYQAVGKTYGYNFMSYMTEKARLKSEDVVYTENDIVEYIMPTLDDVRRQFQDTVANQIGFQESIESLGVDFDEFNALDEAGNQVSTNVDEVFIRTVPTLQEEFDDLMLEEEMFA